MKCVIVALFALVAVASAQFLPYHAYGYAAAPIHHPYAYAAPYHHAYAYAAPAVAAVPAVPAIQSGYVAATRGSVHTAPLPEGPFAASHHINTAPAPGTF